MELGKRSLNNGSTPEAKRRRFEGPLTFTLYTVTNTRTRKYSELKEPSSKKRKIVYKSQVKDARKNGKADKKIHNINKRRIHKRILREKQVNVSQIPDYKFIFI